jgi:nucleotide-binding universal stress UspA family protein
MHCREVAVKKIERILVPTDLSERSLAGVGYALNLAKTLGAEVTVLQASRLMLLLSDMGARRPSFTVDL